MIVLKNGDKVDIGDLVELTRSVSKWQKGNKFHIKTIAQAIEITKSRFPGCEWWITGRDSNDRIMAAPDNHVKYVACPMLPEPEFTLEEITSIEVD